MKLKNALTLLPLASIFLVAFTYVKKAPEDYTVDVQGSTVKWTGKKVGGSHTGSVNLQKGTLKFDGKNLVGGSFEIDMKSIKDADGSEKLDGHLKADDFFGVEKFPTANFVIKKASKPKNGKIIVTGDLTVKGKTGSISFPATVAWEKDGSVTATSDKISFDRSKYDVRYGSKSFFNDLGDKVIDNIITLSVKLIAKK